MDPNSQPKWKLRGKRRIAPSSTSSQTWINDLNSYRAILLVSGQHALEKPKVLVTVALRRPFRYIASRYKHIQIKRELFYAFSSSRIKEIKVLQLAVGCPNREVVVLHALICLNLKISALFCIWFRLQKITDTPWKCLLDPTGSWREKKNQTVWFLQPNDFAINNNYVRLLNEETFKKSGICRTDDNYSKVIRLGFLITLIIVNILTDKARNKARMLRLFVIILFSSRNHTASDLNAFQGSFYTLVRTVNQTGF